MEPPRLMNTTREGETTKDGLNHQGEEEPQRNEKTEKRKEKRENRKSKR
jgi:hypothetical protein